MVDDRRTGEDPVPDNLKEVLSPLQLGALHKIEGFGWKLKYVRRPLFQKVVPVVMSPDGKEIGVLEEDGRINMESEVKLRDA